MGRVYLTFKDGKWHRSKRGNKDSFWINENLLEKLDNLNKIRRNGWDGLIIVDGKERSGKSVLGMSMGWYLSNCKMTINNFSEGIHDIAHKIESLPDGSVIVLDEAGTMLSSGDANTRWQKLLINILEVVGQKNMVFILCLPRFYKLKDDIAVHRSLFLCHVYPRGSDWKRGQFVFFGEKKKQWLYYNAKKNNGSYDEPEADWNAEYCDFEPPFYQEYQDRVKKNTLQRVLDMAKEGMNGNDYKKELSKTVGQIYYKLKKDFNLTTIEMTQLLGHSIRTVNERIQMYRNSLKSDQKGNFA